MENFSVQLNQIECLRKSLLPSKAKIQGKIDFEYFLRIFFE